MEPVAARLCEIGFSEADARTLADHFVDAERRGKTSHGLSRIDWLETLPDLDPAARPGRVLEDSGYERWDGNGALGYLTLAAICDAQLADAARARAGRRRRPAASRPARSATGCGGWPTAGWPPALTATSPARLASPEGGPPLAGTNPIAIGVPSSDGSPLVADVSMGRVTHGDVLAGTAPPEELVPFGGDRAHKAFALAVGLQMLVSRARGRGARRAARRRAARVRPGARATRRSPRGVRLPGDR